MPPQQRFVIGIMAALAAFLHLDRLLAQQRQQRLFRALDKNVGKGQQHAVCPIPVLAVSCYVAPPPVVDGNVADDRQQLGRVAGDRQPPNRTEGLEALVRAVAFGARQQQLFAGLLKIAVAFGIKGFDRLVSRVGQRVGGDPQQVAPVVVPYRFFHRDRFVHNGFSFPLVCKAYAGIAEEMIAESCAARGQRVRRASAFSGFGVLRVCIVRAG